MSSKDEVNVVKLGAIGLGALLLVISFFSCWFIIPPNDVGFTRWLGGTVMESTPLEPGFHLKVPFMETVDRLQITQSMYTLPTMFVYTNDNQEVGINVSVIYDIPKADAYHMMYDIGRAGAIDIDTTVLPVVRNDTQAVFARYNTLDISDKRAEIAQAMEASVSADLLRLFGIHVINVQLTGIQYSPEFNRAVEAAMSAKAAATQAENEVLQRQYQAQQMVETAKGNAEKAVILADANAKARIANAQGEAKAISLVSDALRQNPTYIRWYEASKWDGTLPKYVAGKGVAALPVINTH
jgi:regulator of protease activity HflC (stomatin/prohibitin superfamily)